MMPRFTWLCPMGSMSCRCLYQPICYFWGAAVLVAFEYDKNAQNAVEPSESETDFRKKSRNISSKRGNSYREKDLPLVAEMKRLIDSGNASGIDNAARAVCERAVGKGNPESKRKRLIIAYQLEYPSE